MKKNVLRIISINLSIIVMIVLMAQSVYAISDKNDVYYDDCVCAYKLSEHSMDNTLQVNKAYKYFITSIDPEWKNLQTFGEMKNISQIPIETVKGMTTDVLVETVLSYPPFPVSFVYDDPRYLMESIEDFNGIIELFKRDDSATILLKKYVEINVQKAQLDFNERTRMDHIEVLLANKNIWSKLSSAELTCLANIAVNKYNEKLLTGDFSEQGSAAFFNTLDMSDKEIVLLLKLDISSDLFKYKSVGSGVLIEIPEENLRTPKDTDIINMEPLSSDNIGVRDQVLNNNQNKLDTGIKSVNGVNGFVYTHNGTPVPVIIGTDTVQHPHEYLYYLSWVTTNYPNATFIYGANNANNCHSWAWYWNCTANTIWMDNPSSYMTDGSWKLVTGAGLWDDNVLYTVSSGVISHSGIVEVPGSGNVLPNVISKWGTMAVVYHSVYYCPWPHSYSLWRRTY